MKRSIIRLTRIVVIASMLISVGAIRILAAGNADVIVASGTLDGRFLAGSLLHIGEFWMKVPPNTEFQRWLLQGKNRKVVIMLTANPDQFADAKDVRILSGTLIHQTAPTPTATIINVVGRLPRGDLSLVHVLFLKNELTGTFGPITFETADFDTANKFDPYDDAPINIVIKIE